MSNKNTQQLNPFLFIVGCPRSGTTLLERIVNAHAQIAIIHETHWITRFYKKRIGITKHKTVTPDIIYELCNYHRFHLLKTTREELQELLNSPDPLSYAEFVSRIFDQYGKKEGKKYVGDKTTGGYVRNIPILHKLWPNTRVVHLIRDGRNVCLSMLTWPKANRAAGRLEMWEENPVATTALWWKWHITKGISGGKAADSKTYKELRYESLVDNTKEQCKMLCNYLELPFDESMLRFNEGKQSDDKNASANRAWLSPTPGLRDWQTQMKDQDVEMFEAIAGDTLSELGYGRACNNISQSMANEAARYQQWWDKQHEGDVITTMKATTAKFSINTKANSNMTDNKLKNPYVFVVGCPRSGTTLLQRMLDNHPQLAVANDTHFIPRVIRKLKLGNNPPLTSEVVKEVREYRRFHRLGLSDEAVEKAAETAEDYAEFISGLYAEFSKMHGKKLGGEKTPDYARNLPLLHSLFSWVKSLHIIRDGRDVALSALQWATEDKGPGRIELWQDQPIAVCALWWKRNVNFARIDGTELGEDKYHEILYEQLVDNQEAKLREIAAFLNLPYAEEMSQFHVGKQKDNPNLSAKSAWKPTTSGLRNWRTEMQEEDIQLFEALAGDLLADLGYEQTFNSISAEIQCVADSCQQWWDSRNWDRNSGSRVSKGTTV